MGKEHNTQQLYKLVAGARNVNDFAGLLERLANEAADIRVKLPGVSPADDSIQIRKAISDYLKSSLDNLRRIKENVTSASSDGQDDQ